MKNERKKKCSHDYDEKINKTLWNPLEKSDFSFLQPINFEQDFQPNQNKEIGFLFNFDWSSTKQ